MIFRSKTWFYCIRHWWLNRDTRTAPPPTTPEQAKCATRNPSCSFGRSPARPAKPLFTVHAYSLEQARAIVAAKVAGETIVIGPVARDGGSR